MEASRDEHLVAVKCILEHLMAVKRILRDVAGTRGWGVRYCGRKRKEEA